MMSGDKGAPPAMRAPSVGAEAESKTKGRFGPSVAVRPPYCEDRVDMIVRPPPKQIHKATDQTADAK
ncbi:hypothetical protein VTN00DRAFT_4097 [Thermoascus crustaceus]|uniref:uncharacterized protein n=1 Tax=Thermoascus crustaceus TaxID=5088 RepID=UPI0037432E5B